MGSHLYTILPSDEVRKKSLDELALWLGECLILDSPIADDVFPPDA
jgi:hypothetical protein